MTLIAAPPFSHIATKLHIPATRPRLLARPHLHRLLSRCVQHKLTQIVAPAGFGKTTLLSEWSQKGSWPVAWVSLDAADNDAMRFWSYVVAALDKIETRVGQYVLPIIQSPRPADTRYLLSALINTVATIPDHFVLVLDDYHCIRSLSIHNAMAYLVDYLPPNMHLVLSGRTAPPLPLARWRARGELLEITAVDLRFSLQETTPLFNQVMDLNLSEDSIAAVQERTEGWIAGLQLTGLAIQEQAPPTAQEFGGGHPYIVDYLATEVLHQQTAPLRTFLLQTSILDTLHGPLCNAVTGRTDSQAVLDQLHCRHLFITALGQKGLYRYHHLFADFLREQLAQDETCDATILHLRAAEWYEQQNLLDRAIHHTLQAGQSDEAARLMAKTARQHLMHGEFSTLQSWFEALPEPVIRARPLFCLVYAWVLTNNGQMAAAVRYLDHLKTHLDDSDEARLLQGEAATVRSRIAVIRGDTARNIHYAEQALRLLPPGAALLRSDALLDLAFVYQNQLNFAKAETAFAQTIEQGRKSGNVRTAVLALYYLGKLCMTQGNYQQAAQHFQQGLQWCRETSPPSDLACWAHTGLGALLYEWNDLTRATEHLQQAAQLAQQCGEVKALVYPRLTLARVLQAQGQTEEALKVLYVADQVTQPTHMLSLTRQIDVVRLRIWLEQGQVQRVADWLQRHGIGIRNDDLSPEQIALLAWLYLTDSSTHHQELLHVLDLLKTQCDVAQTQKRMLPFVQHALLLAVVHQAVGQENLAVARLAAAIAPAEQMGLVRTFVDYGAAVVELLRRTAQSTNYTARLLAAFDENATPAKPETRYLAPPSRLAAPDSLRPQEVQVLRHVAQGRSNREIADEMVMAVSTVKWYLRGIYGKLQVHRRTQALARARELNLI